MCGILGILKPNNHVVSVDKAIVALNLMRHRGPDDEGFLLVNSVLRRVQPCGGEDSAPSLALPVIDSFAREPFNDILGHILAIEVVNSKCLFNRFNKKAINFAKEHNIPTISGSDAHFPDELGAAINYSPSKNVFKELSSGNITFDAKHFNVFSFTKHCTQRLFNKI